MDEEMGFLNGYGGWTSFDDDTCLYQSWESEVPSNIPSYDDDF